MSVGRGVSSGPQDAGRGHLGRGGLPGLEVGRLELGNGPVAGAGAEEAGAAKNSIIPCIPSRRSGSPDP